MSKNKRITKKQLIKILKLKNFNNIFKQFVKDFLDNGIYNLVIKEDLTLAEVVVFHKNFNLSKGDRKVLSKMLELEDQIFNYVRRAK